ncbi:MAG: hypothetical protein IJM58_02405 [Muribaculaceae bacterium]|nr:hypothetical protein [Muribaculaceae bacterium]
MEKFELQYGVVSWSGSGKPLQHEIDTVKYHLARVMPQMVDMEWKFDEKASADTMSLTARRVNLANMGQEAFATLKFDSVLDITPRLLTKWSKAATDVLDPRPGDVVIDVDVFETDECSDMVAESCPAPAAKPSVRLPKRSVIQSLRDVLNRTAGSVFNEMMLRRDLEPPCRPTLEDREERQIAALDMEQQRAIGEIQAAIIRYVTTYHADPKELLLKLQGLIIVDDKPSPLVVNGDMEIVLSHYDEIVVKMPALIKAVYILFLLHPEGIVLKNFGAYRNELEEVYAIVMPNRDEQLARDSIDNLCDPLSNTLNEYLAKIKKSFKRYIVNDKLLDEYRITGRRGQPYGIALSRDLVTLPAIFA